MLSRRFLAARAVAIALAFGITSAFAGTACAADTSIVVASTTSTQDSGLFGYLLPIFKARTGIDVKVVAQGTGQALDTARRGDADSGVRACQGGGGEAHLPHCACSAAIIFCRMRL